MDFIKKNFFAGFLIIYFLIGSTNSLNSGISFDENYEELNWKFHVSLITKISSKIISGENIDTEKLKSEAKGFVGYGIGFQIISQPIQSLLGKIFTANSELDSYGLKLLCKHFVVFFFLFLGFFLFNSKKILDSEIFPL